MLEHVKPVKGAAEDVRYAPGTGVAYIRAFGGQPRACLPGLLGVAAVARGQRTLEHARGPQRVEDRSIGSGIAPSDSVGSGSFGCCACITGGPERFGP